jgi:hypothetical protein
VGDRLIIINVLPSPLKERASVTRRGGGGGGGGGGRPEGRLKQVGELRVAEWDVLRFVLNRVEHRGEARQTLVDVLRFSQCLALLSQKHKHTAV